MYPPTRRFTERRKILQQRSSFSHRAAASPEHGFSRRVFGIRFGDKPAHDWLPRLRPRMIHLEGANAWKRL